MLKEKEEKNTAQVNGAEDKLKVASQDEPSQADSNASKKRTAAALKESQ